MERRSNIYVTDIRAINQFLHFHLQMKAIHLCPINMHQTMTNHSSPHGPPPLHTKFPLTSLYNNGILSFELNFS